MPELRPFDYYVGGGCVTQTVWNALTGREPNYGIHDVDIVYYDPDPAEQKERGMARHIADKLDGLPMETDIKNEARVHLWYERRFGYPVKPCRSVEDAIRTCICGIFSSAGTAGGKAGAGPHSICCFVSCRRNGSTSMCWSGTPGDAGSGNRSGSASGSSGCGTMQPGTRPGRERE